VGWRGVLRSVAAAARAAEREALRQQKERQRAELFAATAGAVDEWEAHLARMVSLHTNLAAPIDWRSIAERPRPEEPACNRPNERRATAALANFAPSVFDVFRGGAQKRRASLVAAVATAVDRDERDHRNARLAHEQALVEWNDDVALATRILRCEASAMRGVIDELIERDDAGLLGTSIGFDVADDFVHARPFVHGVDIVPTTVRRQLASGRLSETPMPTRRFHELYRDYVASAALKTAGDLLRRLPLSEIWVTCIADMLNTRNGHFEPTPILSVRFVRPTFLRLNLGGIVPSEALRNFRHEMSFSTTKGLAAIEPLSPHAP